MDLASYTANLLKALAHPARLGILNVLRVDGECCVCHLEHRLGMRQAYISQQLARLRESGLVADRREGLNVFYAITEPHLESLLAAIDESAVAIAAGRGMGPLPGVLSNAGDVPCPCPHCEMKRIPTAG